MKSFEKAQSKRYDIFERREGVNVSRGRVKWFNNEKGYGFIEFTDENDEDIFVHYSAIECDGYKTLREGDIVDFKLIKTTKGNQAINVREVKLTTV